MDQSNQITSLSAEEELLLTEEDCFPVIEACLFAAGHPLKYEKLGEVLGMSANACRETVEKIRICFCGDMCGTKNTAHSASVRAQRVRSRAQNSKKREVTFLKKV